MSFNAIDVCLSHNIGRFMVLIPIQIWTSSGFFCSGDTRIGKTQGVEPAISSIIPFANNLEITALTLARK